MVSVQSYCLLVIVTQDYTKTIWLKSLKLLERIFMLMAWCAPLVDTNGTASRSKPQTYINRVFL